MVCVLALLLAACGSGSVTAVPTPASFTYPVRVQDGAAKKNIAGANVTIEVGGQPPVDDLTDSNGYAQLPLAANYVGKAAKLRVEVSGYEPFLQNIQLVEGLLPDTIVLSPQLSEVDPPTPVLTATSTEVPPTATSDAQKLETPAPVVPTQAMPTITNAPPLNSAEGAVIFSDPFDVIIRPEWEVRDNNFSVESGSLKTVNGLILYDTEVQDYTVNITTATPTFKIWFRTETRGSQIINAYYVYCEGYECRWYKVQDTNYSLITTFNLNDDSLYNEKTHLVKLEVKGPNFILSIDDQIVNSIYDDSFSTGKVGLGGIGKSNGTIYDQFDLISGTTNHARISSTSKGSLFSDSFDVLIRPEWEVRDNSFSVGAGTLRTVNGMILYDTEVQDYTVYITTATPTFKIWFRTETRGSQIINAYYVYCEGYECRWYKIQDANYSPITTFNLNDDSLYNEKTHLVKLEAKGSNFILSIDDQIVNSIYDDTFSAGKVGLGGIGKSNGTIYDQFDLISGTTNHARISSTSEGSLFSDSFDVLIRPEWEVRDNSFSVGAGTLRTVNGVLLYDTEVRDYTVNITTATPTFKIWFRTETRESQIINAYYVYCKGIECRWYKIQDANYSLITTFNLNDDSLYNEKTHLVKLEVKGSNFILSIDNQIVNSIYDDSFSAGKVGLGGTGESNGTIYDQFGIYK
jgi:hypothetical protein